MSLIRKTDPNIVWEHQSRLAALQRRLVVLEKQQALNGNATSPEVLLEIEDLRDVVAREEIRKRFEQGYRAGQSVGRWYFRIDRTIKLVSKTEPPWFAVYLLWFLPRKDREAVMGDLEEEFHEVRDAFGWGWAALWYYFQVGASFWPYALSAAKKLIAWGVVGWVGQAIRRFIP
jgi:hypothetical protein